MRNVVEMLVVGSLKLSILIARLEKLFLNTNNSRVLMSYSYYINKKVEDIYTGHVLLNIVFPTIMWLNMQQEEDKKILNILYQKRVESRTLKSQTRMVGKRLKYIILPKNLPYYMNKHTLKSKKILKKFKIIVRRSRLRRI